LKRYIYLSIDLKTISIDTLRVSTRKTSSSSVIVNGGAIIK